MGYGRLESKISSPIAPTRSGCRTPCAAEPCRSFGRSPGAGRGLAAVGFFIPAIIGLHSALSKRLSTNSEILLAASPHAGSVDIKRRLSARRARRRPASLLREPAQPRPAKPGAIVAAQVGDLGRRAAGRDPSRLHRPGPLCRRRAPRRGPLRGRARPPGPIAAPQMTAAGANTDELFTVSTSPTAISDLNA